MKLKLILKIILICSIVFYFGCTEKKSSVLLPIYGEKKIIDGDTIYHQIASFNLTNQIGQVVNQNTTKNKIYIANFFFATCQSICPMMSNQLQEVQKAFLADDSVLILSHSVNPLHDTVAVLSNYADTYGAKTNKWHLLTGNKKQIYDLAKTSYLVNAFEDDGSPEGFLHSELFLLIDKKARIRGMYDGTNTAEVKKLIEDVKLLKQETY
jgi:protein SCO1/2